MGRKQHPEEGHCQAHGGTAERAIPAWDQEAQTLQAEQLSPLPEGTQAAHQKMELDGFLYLGSVPKVQIAEGTHSSILFPKGLSMIHQGHHS